LSPGYQAVQPAHALAEFAIKFPKTFKTWQTTHKNLVVLSTSNELALRMLSVQAAASKIRGVIFCEPDIGNEATALCLEPCDETYRITSSLPLALKEFNTVDGRKALGG
jgi:hypothetical protein